MTHLLCRGLFSSLNFFLVSVSHVQGNSPSGCLAKKNTDRKMTSVKQKACALEVKKKTWVIYHIAKCNANYVVKLRNRIRSLETYFCSNLQKCSMSETGQALVHIKQMVKNFLQSCCFVIEHQTVLTVLHFLIVL